MSDNNSHTPDDIKQLQEINREYRKKLKEEMDKIIPKHDNGKEITVKDYITRRCFFCSRAPCVCYK